MFKEATRLGSAGLLCWDTGDWAAEEMALGAPDGCRANKNLCRDRRISKTHCAEP